MIKFELYGKLAESWTPKRRSVDKRNEKQIFFVPASFFFAQASHSRDSLGFCFHGLRRWILHNFAQNFNRNGLLEP